MAKINDLKIVPYTKDRIDDVIRFENDLRKEEDVWGWSIDDEYKRRVKASFDNSAFDNSMSFLAYADEKIVGRIDVAIICSRFDGGMTAYLDWICVLKSYRHIGVAQALLEEIRSNLKAKGISTLVALTAANEEAQRFYRNIPDSSMHDVGIWIDIK